MMAKYLADCYTGDDVIPEPKGEDTLALCQINDEELGIIRLMKWPEGYVLWCGGVIVWKSWEPK